MSQQGLPASFAQERLWFLDQLEPGTAAYNLVRAFRITGPLHVKALTSAIHAVIQRHESLRTIFESVEGQAMQVVLPDFDVQVPIIDLTNHPGSDRKREALRIASEEGKKPFDLTRGPLFRALLVRLSDDQHLMVLVMHHIITDGWSISILFQELADFYEDFVTNRKPALPELPVQYAEYAQWQREYLTGDVLAKQVKYWKEKLAGAPPILDLPTDFTRPENHSWHGATEELVFASEILSRLKEFAQSEGATLFMVSMAAFQALLWRYTGHESILVGTPIAARNQIEIEKLIGFFVNTLVFRSDFNANMSFRDLVRQVRGFALDAYSHQDIPFEKLVEELVPQRSMNTSPLFQVMFTFQNIPKQIFEIAGLELEELEFETGIAKFDLSVEAYEDDQFHCRFEYNTDLFEKQTILRNMSHFRNLVHAVLKNPDGALAQIPLMDRRESDQTVVQWNSTSVDYPEEQLQTAFEQQTKRKPDSTAYIFNDKRVSYREINENANRLAHYLIKKKVGPGSLVGVCIARSPQTTVALLAVLKAGAAYVPLDPAYPIPRLKTMIEDTGAEYLLSTEELAKKLPENVSRLIMLDSDAAAIQRESAANPGLNTSDVQLAYVLYTSGTSGRPKGVEGTHRGAMNRMRWMWERYGFEAGEVCCQKTNIGFVDSVQEIFSPLLAGVPSVILPQETVLDPEELLCTLAGHHVTRIVLVPSLLRAVLDHAPNLGERVPELKLWSCSGEVLTWELARRFQQAHPRSRLLNIYGSSEVAADVTWYEVEADVDTGPGAYPFAEVESGSVAESENSERRKSGNKGNERKENKEDGRAHEGSSSVPIGRPISNSQVYVLDGNMNPVPIGVGGEIYVGGAGLALGYWKQAELTAERFVGNPIAPELSEKLYRTGDIGRWRRTGELEYVGRVDSEVKVRGMRIELGEIETILGGHEWVEEAVVELSGEDGDQRLVAYVVGAEGEPGPSARELRRYVRGKLPEHMVPSRFVRVREMPLLTSGKVNRRGLKAVAGEGLKEEEEVAKPRTEAEKKLAGMWAEVLKLREEQVGVEQNFFEIGGHSLLVLQVMARIRREFGVELGVRVMFEEPTIAGLASEVEKARALGLEVRTPVLERRPRPAASDGRTSREALLAQLDTLSADDVQTLLKRVLEAKQANGTEVTVPPSPRK